MIILPLQLQGVPTDPSLGLPGATKGDEFQRGSLHWAEARGGIVNRASQESQQQREIGLENKLKMEQPT